MSQRMDSKGGIAPCCRSSTQSVHNPRCECEWTANAVAEILFLCVFFLFSAVAVVI